MFHRFLEHLPRRYYVIFFRVSLGSSVPHGSILYIYILYNTTYIYNYIYTLYIINILPSLQKTWKRNMTSWKTLFLYKPVVGIYFHDCFREGIYTFSDVESQPCVSLLSTAASSAGRGKCRFQSIGSIGRRLRGRWRIAKD